MIARCLLGFILLVFLVMRPAIATADDTSQGGKRPQTGPWVVARLLDTPIKATYGAKKGLVQEVYYDAEPYQGHPTQVFAYYARPEGRGPFPAMLLVHGGGGQAFAEWAEMWARRGYAALAMDLNGSGPDGKRLPDGGPPADHEHKLHAFRNDGVRDMWTYQAVAAVLRGHAMLESRTEVDPNRVGITGISWGGYLTCIVAGIDPRLKVAVPVYGCGFETDAANLTKLNREDAARWRRYLDPANYLPGVRCPMFFLNGTNDFAYPIIAWQKSFNLVSTPVTLRLTVKMPHSHPAGWAPPEIMAYVDSVLRDGKPLIGRSEVQIIGNTATATLPGTDVPVSAELHYTTNQGERTKRKWKTMPAKIDGRRLSGFLPPARPIISFFTIKDSRGMIVSTDFRQN